MVKKEAEIAIIYNPVLKQHFSARRGKGAFYNDNQIHVSDKKDLSQALVITEFGTSRDEKKLDINIENFRKIVQSTHGYVKTQQLQFLFRENSIKLLE